MKGLRLCPLILLGSLATALMSTTMSLRETEVVFQATSWGSSRKEKRTMKGQG